MRTQLGSEITLPADKPLHPLDSARVHHHSSGLSSARGHHQQQSSHHLMSAICTMVEKKPKGSLKVRQESFNDRVRQEAQLEVSR